MPADLQPAAKRPVQISEAFQNPSLMIVSLMLSMVTALTAPLLAHYRYQL